MLGVGLAATHWNFAGRGMGSFFSMSLLSSLPLPKTISNQNQWMFRARCWNLWLEIYETFRDSNRVFLMLSCAAVGH